MSARKYSLQDMQKAIAAVRTGKFSVNKAAKMHNVSFTTLWRRIKDYVPDNCFRPGPKPVLGTTLESKLVDAINEMQSMGFRIIRKEILDLACKIDSLLPTPAFKGKLPSNRWMQRFIARHNINMDHSEHLPNARFGMSREEVLDKFFETFINKVKLEFTTFSEASNQLSQSRTLERLKVEETQSDPILYCDTVLETTQDENLEYAKCNKTSKRKLNEQSPVATPGPSKKMIIKRSIDSVNKCKRQNEIKHADTTEKFENLHSDRDFSIHRMKNEDAEKYIEEETSNNSSLDIVHLKEEKSCDSYYDETSISSDDENHSDEEIASQQHSKDSSCMHTIFGGSDSGKNSSLQLSDNGQKKKIFKCDDCEKCFTNKSELKKHLIIHKGIIHLCDQCGKFFHDKAALDTHLLLHKGVGYNCTLCGKSFSWKCSLESHMSSHKDLLSHVCKECGIEFASKSALTTHMFFHRGVEFRCKVCEKCFSRKQTLQKHENKCHKGFPWC